MEFLNRILNNQALMFYTLLVISLLLTRIPFIGKYFRSVNTMIHEAGHALMTLIVSGEIISVNLFADTSGTTVTKAKNKFFQCLIAAAGYPVSALTGFVLILLLMKGFPVYVLFILVSITLLLMVLSIRNTYGLFWAGSFSLIILLIIYFDQPIATRIASTFFSLIILTDSLISSVVLFALSIKNPKKAGDASNLQKFTRIPAVIWALLFMAFSGFMFYEAAVMYFPPLKNILDF